MKILVLGGDGFCGWPTALNLSSQGHEVVIVDNLSRRKIDMELGVDSLTPIRSIEQRISTWNGLSQIPIEYININLADQYDDFVLLIKDMHPDAIMHFAEQRSAPYSMKSPKHRRYTVDNNLNATHNVCSAIVESKQDIHLIHLGTMGVYGYNDNGSEIPEGYLTATVKGVQGESVDMEFLHPSDPGSIYHMTKVQDQQFFYFYNKNYNLRITDLHQGIVWGTQTAETEMHDDLINRFDYDGDYGTVLNRFLMQAALSYPLTVYGSGGQTRAFIHIQDTVKCLSIALNTPPATNERVKIYNQMTETHKVSDLARLLAQLAGAEIQCLDNPRKERQNNGLNVSNKCLLNEGLNPTKLSDGLLAEVVNIARKYADRCNPSLIPSTSKW